MLNSQKSQEVFTGLLGEVLKVHNPKLSEKFDLEGVRHLVRRGAKFNKQYHEVLTKVVGLEEENINTETPERIEQLLGLMTELNNLVNFVDFTDTKAMVFYDPNISNSNCTCHFYVVLKNDLVIINEIMVAPQGVNANSYEASLDVVVDNSSPKLIMEVSGGHDYTVRGEIKVKDPSSIAQALRNIAQEEVKHYEEQDGNVGMMLAGELSYLANGAIDLSYSINKADLQSVVNTLQVMLSVRNIVTEKIDGEDSKEKQLNSLTTYVDTAVSSYKNIINTLLEAFKEVATTLDEQAQELHDLDNEDEGYEEDFEEEEEYIEEIECGVNCDCVYNCEKEEEEEG